jgi:hypothetical protein
LLAQAGAAGIAHHDLRKAVDLEPDTLDALLAALKGIGQITVAMVNGQWVYRVNIIYR